MYRKKKTKTSSLINVFVIKEMNASNGHMRPSQKKKFNVNYPVIFFAFAEDKVVLQR